MDVYDFKMAGEVFVEVNSWDFISEEDFTVLKKYV